MAGVTIPTARLDLVLQSPDEVLAWIDSLPPADRAEVSPDWIARIQTSPPGNPWVFSYTALERSTGTAIGTCAFKGPPDRLGMVEIAYGIDPVYRRQGFATEIAMGLVQFALATGQVRVVRAHTKNENPASARVLAKCGFRSLGEVIEPEDGLVCRWEYEPS